MWPTRSSAGSFELEGQKQQVHWSHLKCFVGLSR